MVDKFADPLLTAAEASRHLGIPRSTLQSWLKDDAPGGSLVHEVPARKRGYPSMPFVAVIEAYVLRSLRDLGLSKATIRQAALEVREAFDTPYALAAKRIVTDGVDLFIRHSPDQYTRVGDQQVPIREVLEDYLRDISFDKDGFPGRLRLRRYADAAELIIDPRFAWGAPVVADQKVPIHAVVDLWRAGEPMTVVADEFDLSPATVESICRVAA
ncbi:DUF433 domain-containing protein [Phytoactinopolyspora sp. XMNu-373]|uniref:DUF433 domain-containing protein n=2 Tax=Phytoactinopolyspora mesophila TaxID=2650750 RepID=A0A7K3MCT4_9ACTN|nr:DUF433 domain-containing protein [Phytoactinopolyspora mesophila]